MISIRAFRTCALNAIVFFGACIFFGACVFIGACSGSNNEARDSSGPDSVDAGEAMGRAPSVGAGETMEQTPSVGAGETMEQAPFDPETRMAECNEERSSAECLFFAIDLYAAATECGSSPPRGAPERRVCLEMAYENTDPEYRSCMEASQWKLSACAVVAACDVEKIILCSDEHLARTKKCPSAPPALLDAIDICTLP